MRLREEGVDNLGFKRKRLKFQGSRKGKAGEVFWKCNLIQGPINALHSHDARPNGPVGDGASGAYSDRSPAEIGLSSM